jgi:hypothetical protein
MDKIQPTGEPSYEDSPRCGMEEYNGKYFYNKTRFDRNLGNRWEIGCFTT